MAPQLQQSTTPTVRRIGRVARQRIYGRYYIGAGAVTVIAWFLAVVAMWKFETYGWKPLYVAAATTVGTLGTAWWLVRRAIELYERGIEVCARVVGANSPILGANARIAVFAYEWNGTVIKFKVIDWKTAIGSEKQLLVCPTNPYRRAFKDELIAPKDEESSKCP